METHPEPSKAKSDGANMLRLELMDNLLGGLVKLKRALI
jgi:2-dehydro-3-deoxyphosphooctonate aldolase (KDO 8-P synthase)